MSLFSRGRARIQSSETLRLEELDLGRRKYLRSKPTPKPTGIYVNALDGWRCLTVSEESRYTFADSLMPLDS
jgi:hypothetical protein